MVTFGRVGQYVVGMGQPVVYAFTDKNKNLLDVRSVFEALGRALHDVYATVEGLERLTKAAIATFRFAALVPRMQSAFDDALKTFEAQKDLYYATRFIHSTVDNFIEHLPNVSYGFKMPKRHNGAIDVSKILLTVGDYLDTLRFLHRYKVYVFSSVSQLSSTYGAVKVFNRRLDDLPALYAVFEKPKDFCVFVAMIFDTWHCLNAPKFDWEQAYKLTGSLGKMVLIFFGKHYYNRWWFAVADVITQDASLITYIYKRSVKRNGF